MKFVSEKAHRFVTMISRWYNIQNVVTLQILIWSNVIHDTNISTLKVEAASFSEMLFPTHHYMAS
jgi:hypothetical protein